MIRQTAPQKMHITIAQGLVVWGGVTNQETTLSNMGSNFQYPLVVPSPTSEIVTKSSARFQRSLRFTRPFLLGLAPPAGCYRTSGVTHRDTCCPSWYTEGRIFAGNREPGQVDRFARCLPTAVEAILCCMIDTNGL